MLIKKSFNRGTLYGWRKLFPEARLFKIKSPMPNAEYLLMV